MDEEGSVIVLYLWCSVLYISVIGTCMWGRDGWRRQCHSTVPLVFSVVTSTLSFPCMPWYAVSKHKKATARYLFHDAIRRNKNDLQNGIGRQIRVGYYKIGNRPFSTASALTAREQWEGGCCVKHKREVDEVQNAMIKEVGILKCVQPRLQPAPPTRLHALVGSAQFYAVLLLSSGNRQSSHSYIFEHSLRLGGLIW